MIMQRLGSKQSLIIVLLGLACSWIIGGSILSLFGDGWLYSIEQPVPVVSVSADTVILELHRYCRWNMAGICARELQCKVLTHYGAEACPLERGEASFQLASPLPEASEGPCAIRGTIEYEPLGRLGPRLTYHWQSETFNIVGASKD